MCVVALNEKNFEKEVLNASESVLVDFYADWCGPCKMMAPIIEEIANAETRANVKVGKVNVDENGSLAEKYGIMSIPTMIIFKNGQIIKTFVGLTNRKTIEDAL